jgi:hypothetical protein
MPRAARSALPATDSEGGYVAKYQGDPKVLRKEIRELVKRNLPEDVREELERKAAAIAELTVILGKGAR